MQAPEIRILGIQGLPEVVVGDNIGELIAHAVGHEGITLQNRDIFVVAQKIVSKSEGRVLRVDSFHPSALAQQWAETYGKDPRRVEIVMGQARHMVRMERGVMIAQTHHGYVCANAGVDASNMPPGTVSLLPKDPDLSAAEIRATLERIFGVPLAVIVADTFGRPWRQGIVNVALGVAGLAPLLDYRGKPDSYGSPLESTVVAVADELASAAELVMGKTSGIPVALVRGFFYEATEGSGRDMIRPEADDLFIK